MHLPIKLAGFGGVGGGGAHGGISISFESGPGLNFWVKFLGGVRVMVGSFRRG